MKATLYIITLILFLTVGSACSVTKPQEPLRALPAISYSAGFSIMDSFQRLSIPLAPDMVMRGFEDARQSIRPQMPKGEMRMILRDPKQYLADEKGTLQADNEMKAVNGLAAVGYATGFRMGDTFKKQRVRLTPDMVLRGLEDAHNSIQPLIPPEKMQMILRDPKKYLIEDVSKSGEQVKKSAEDFMAENATKEGVQVLESGLQYKIITVGSGEKPELNESVRVDYQASTIKGQVFDSTDKMGKPAVFVLNSVIPGLAEGLQLMSEGAEWELYIPSNLAFRNAGPLAGQALVYTVKLIEIMPEE